MTSWVSSARAPAISTPVAPAPTTTKVSAPSETSSGLRLASSNSWSTRERSRSASSSEYSGKVNSSAPGVWKKFGWEPAASTTASAASSLWSASVTVFASGSAATTSAVRTSTLSCRWNMGSRSKAMSLGVSSVVATWYSSGWNWW